MNSHIRLLTPADIPAAMRIKEAAGWNQTETDWRNLLYLARDLCFGMECDGVLAATTTAVCYQQKLAWIGMVLTAPEHRRRGFARELMEHAIAALMARRIDWIKLDATEMGAPLYRDLGFETECAIERWGADLGRAVIRGDLAEVTGGLPAVDMEAFGADRSDLLHVLAPLGAAAIAGEAFAMERPGSKAAYFGPCVSRGPEAAAKLLTWFLAKHAGKPVCCDLMPDNAEAVLLAESAGFSPQRRLFRMVRPGVRGAAPLIHDDSRIFATAGLEYG